MHSNPNLVGFEWSGGSINQSRIDRPETSASIDVDGSVEVVGNSSRSKVVSKQVRLF